MFRTVSIAGFIITITGIVLHYMIFGPKLDDLFGRDRRWRILDGFRMMVFLLTLLLLPQKVNFIGIVRKLVYLFALLCFVVLAVTGFFPRLVLDKTIYGYWLMIHATFAPVFAVCLGILAVMWADNCRFDKNYCPWLQKLLEREPLNPIVGGKLELAQKIFFWLIIFLALPLILSIVLSMFSFFGTDAQGLLLNLHRYIALVLALSIIVHIYLLILGRMKQ